jgi:3-oxoacyl-[acyl-carrier protein] reductase
VISLAGKSAIVTGASRGIGLAVARALEREGVRLVLLSRTPPPSTLAGRFIRCDLGELDGLPACCAEARDILGTVDFLVNNAGVFLEKPVPNLSPAEWKRVQDVNVTAPFVLCRELIPHMIARKTGAILNIASSASHQGYLYQSAYTASKHALLGFARSLAMELRPHGIRVHTLCPGGVDTDLIKGTHLADRLRGQTMIAPADIAELVVFVLKQPGNIDLPELVVRRFVP